MADIQVYIVEITVQSYTNEDYFCFGIEDVYEFIKSDPVLQIPIAVLDTLAPKLFQFALSNQDTVEIDIGIEGVSIYIQKNVYNKSKNQII